MTGPTHGSLFSGYEGAGLALESIWPDTRTAWVSDIEPGPRKVLAHRYPDAPNLGDITKIDWSQVEPVDIITGGSPCQDLSHAGKRMGMRPGTRSGLWASMLDGIEALRPSLAIWENVRGAYSAEADSEMEPCSGCVGDGYDGPVLRALGRVLGDLAEIGYDAIWAGLRAADVGACHGRFRVFVVAWPADTERERWLQWRVATPGQAASGWTPAIDRGRGGALVRLPTHRATDGTKGGPNQRGSSGDLMLPSAVAQLLPTPAVNDMGKAYTPDEWDEWTEAQKAKHGNGNGHGKSLEIEAARMALMPTLTGGLNASNIDNAKSPGFGNNGENFRQIIDENRWGQYAPAIARHEAALGRPAPAPVEPTGKNGANRLSPRFTEFMMGLPSGWITDVPDVTRNEALRLCGNGIVPQQMAEAVRWCLEQREAFATPSERAA